MKHKTHTILLILCVLTMFSMINSFRVINTKVENSELEQDLFYTKADKMVHKLRAERLAIENAQMKMSGEVVIKCEGFNFEEVVRPLPYKKTKEN